MDNIVFQEHWSGLIIQQGFVTKVIKTEASPSFLYFVFLRVQRQLRVFTPQLVLVLSAAGWPVIGQRQEQSSSHLEDR